MALYLLDKYKDQITLKFADLNQEVIQAHLAQSQIHPFSS